MRGAYRVVVALSLLLQGCAALVVERPPVPAAGRVSPQVGPISGQPGLVIGAPYASPDDLIGQISLELARRTGFGLVVATDSDRDRRGADRAYQLRVEEVSRGPLRFYVEMRGGNHQEAAGRIEIATVGVGSEEAWKLRTLFELIRDSHLGSRRELPRLGVLVEPAEADGSSVKRLALLHLPERAIQIELPPAARTLGREVYTEILAEFLKESSRLLLAGGQ